MEDFTLGTTLDTRTGASPEPVRRVEVLSAMVGRRRSWSLEQKLAIVAEAQGCDNLTALARRHDIRTSQLYTALANGHAANCVGELMPWTDVG